MRRGLHILLIMLFAARSFVPAAFMLQASPADGTLTIVICTASGSKTIPVDADESPAPDQQKRSTSDSCPFASATTTALASDTAPTLAAEVRYAAVVYTLTADLFRATPKPRDLSARGPPTLA